eukprot:5880293-Prymnesium_polylepis.5
MSWCVAAWCVDVTLTGVDQGVSLFMVGLLISRGIVWTRTYAKSAEVRGDPRRSAVTADRSAFQLKWGYGTAAVQ